MGRRNQVLLDSHLIELGFLLCFLQDLDVLLLQFGQLRLIRAAPGKRAYPMMARHSVEMIQCLASILAEIRRLSEDFDRFKNAHNDFAVRTTNEIDFLKIDKPPTTPGEKQARFGKAALSSMVV
ncbi:MAG: hypothetical protein PHU71_06470 [Candidatus Gracilibacteria bacterium]|nr:hypothetical protein [Candidatus Gracilibacteria bacterium]